MGKRSDFVKNPRDFYETPLQAVIPLLPYLPKTFEFSQPCAGSGQLVDHLEKHGGHCLWKSDIYPLRPDIQPIDFFSIASFPAPVIENPPWDRKFLHPMIDRLLELSDDYFWLLFDADWIHTKQSAAYMKYCSDIVSVGRVKWIPDSKMTGKDNCCWYRFSAKTSQTIFHGR
jgi:hypothetical protein